jgi:hypothetical protein
MAGPLTDSGPKGWLDIGSYGRRGPGRRDRLSSAHLGFITRTVHRAPEVMIKMLNQGGRDLGSVARHLRYLDRDGELEVETDDGERLKGKDASKALLEDWDLELDAMRPSTADHKPRQAGKQSKLVHKMIFSMPAGAPPEKVLGAAKDFAREEFGAKHRYAMVLHTDEPHPHVHMVVKAMGYDGTRLNIRKATLREWRQQFARHLREHGIEAHATERAVRGVTRPQKRDGIYRAERRRDSIHWRQRTAAVKREMTPDGDIRPELGKAKLLATRLHVIRGWNGVAEDLDRQGQGELALEVRRFVTQLPPVRSEREYIRDQILQQSKGADREQFVNRWKQDALATWRTFRGQQQAAEQARQTQQERARQLELVKARTRPSIQRGDRSR